MIIRGILNEDKTLNKEKLEKFDWYNDFMDTFQWLKFQVRNEPNAEQIIEEFEDGFEVWYKARQEALGNLQGASDES